MHRVSKAKGDDGPDEQSHVLKASEKANAGEKYNCTGFKISYLKVLNKMDSKDLDTNNIEVEKKNNDIADDANIEQKDRKSRSLFS